MEEGIVVDILKSGIQWSLTDEGMGHLERAGLAGLYLSLTSAERRAAEGEPKAKQLGEVLHWKTTDACVRLDWQGEDLAVMSTLMEWAWQIRDGVYYLPGIHTDNDARDNWILRIQTHSGLLGTFLQSGGPVKPDVGEPVTIPVQLDPDNLNQTITVRYRPIKSGEKTRQLGALKTKKICPLRNKQGKMRTISLPGWISPGAAKRFGEIEENWTGLADKALLLLFAPIACFYISLPSTKSKKSMRDNWAFLVPEIKSLTEFAERCHEVQTRFQRRFDDLKVAGLGDGGLRFAVIYSGNLSLRHLQTPVINLTSMGVTDYYSSLPTVTSRIRTQVLKLHPSHNALVKYSKLMHYMSNTIVKIKVSSETDEGTEESEITKATHWIRIPTARGRIAHNLVHNLAWYTDLIYPTHWQIDALEKQREKLSNGTSRERLWFMNLQREWRELMELAEEDVMWDSPEEKALLSIFHGALRRLLDKETEALSRGGSRSLHERWDRRVEGIRRDLLHAKTLILVRKFVMELLAEAGGSKDLTDNKAAIWRLVNHPGEWKKARDLALLALVTFTDGRLAKSE